MTARRPTLLITGASGRLGRRVLELLLEAKAGPLIAVTRTPEKLKDFARRGVEVRHGDFDQPQKLVKAFEGAERLLLISTDEVGIAGGRHRLHRAAIDAAVAAGVKHVIYTGAAAPYPSEVDLVPNDHYRTEQALLASGLGWTVLRHNIYAEMILMALPNAVASGQLLSATAGGGRNYVTREDCARVAAAVLASKKYDGRFVDVTGPGPVTQDEIAAIASEVTGKPVKHIDVPADALRQGMMSAGVPQVVADLLTAFDVAASQGYHAVATPVVKELTGREPTSVREFLAANRAALLAAAA